MINFEKFTLKNGLRVVVHEDCTTPLAAVNILYDVGARDEHPEKTGFAHLFEHLMFGGSTHVTNFDEHIQRAGGVSNAFTTNDITNYYTVLPASNLETALWLESDRMLSLAFSKKSLDVQRNVVIEEFKEHYLNRPYGDSLLKLMSLAYSVHPYRWMPIGKDIAHIQQANLEDVKNFFFQYYRPNNAIMVIAGNVKAEKVRSLVEKWFADIPAGKVPKRDIPKEPTQTQSRYLTLRAKVPADAIYKAYHACARTDPTYYAQDILSDILAAGKSSRFYLHLVKGKNYFSEIDAYLTDTLDKGLFIIEGLLIKGVNLEEAENAIGKELLQLGETLIPPPELEKVKNNIEAEIMLSRMHLLSRTIDLAYFELIGDAAMINHELEKYQMVTAEQIRTEAQKIFCKENSSTLYYLAQNNEEGNAQQEITTVAATHSAN